MVATLTIPEVVEVDVVRRFRICMGTAFVLSLRGVYGRVSWSAENDEVLEIVDDGGFTAKFKATSVGRSVLTITAGRDQLILTIDVFEEPTVKVDFSFGNIRPVDKP